MLSRSIYISNDTSFNGIQYHSKTWTFSSFLSLLHLQLHSSGYLFFLLCFSNIASHHPLCGFLVILQVFQPIMSLFVYSPSIAGACVAAIALVLVMIAMVFFNKKTRSLVLAPFLFAMMLEAAAAIARSSYSTHPDSLHTFYVAYFLPMLVPRQSVCFCS